MDGQRYQIEWVDNSGEDAEIISEEVISMDSSRDVDDEVADEYLVGEEIISSAEMNSIPNSLDQIAAENLIYMAHDGQVTAMSDLIEEQVEQVENADYNEQQYFECQVTEEVITDDWVQPQGEERVEIPVDQLSGGDHQIIAEIEVPLPTDQDEYTALRPYPCDFCSRRFRKKASLMNHMIAHQNDRPHVCNLCGARYIRRSDLLNHLKIHAHVPEDRHDYVEDSFINDHIEAKQSIQRNNYYEEYENIEKPKLKPKRGRGRKPKIKEEEKYVEPEVESMAIPQLERYPITDPRKPFVCQQCGVGFAREKALMSHSRIHGGDSPYECVTCNEMFWDANMLHDHQRTHHFEASNSEYEPENDDEETESENDSKFGEFYCDVCGMSFHRQDLLRRHSKTHIKKEIMEGEARQCCNVCGETFAEALDLLAHAEVHARFQPFKCMLCGETFLEEATIKKHLTNVHIAEMNANSCKLCGKQCRDGRALMKHAWDHSREKNHSCSKCGKTFHNKARLKRHMVSHRNKSVTCDVCGEEFPDGRSLMNHRHSHSNVSGRLFPCNECGKTFGSRSSQQIHVRIHTGERPYGCRYCWKAFADGGTLRKHERIHTGEKPYACSVCPRAFNQRVVLREHIRSHHSAPDEKRGTPQMPFYCTVCSDLFGTSVDLIQHLIQHSDMNTAMQRQPITGPRKYKRRRKLKPHELERLRNEKTNPSDIEYSDLDMGNVDDLLGLSNKNKKSRSRNISTSIYATTHSTTSRNRKYSGGSDKNSWQHKLISSNTSEDTYNGVFQNIENALQNIDPLVVNNSTSSATAATQSSSAANPSQKYNRNPTRRRTNKQDIDKKSRPKMIHTQKTRVAVDAGKRKTRTMITRTTPTEIDDQVFQQFDRTKTASRKHENSGCEYDFIMPPDTGSNPDNHYSSRVIVKQEHPSQSDLFDAQLLLEAASMRKEIDKYNPDVVNDLEEILRSPIKSKSSPTNSSQNINSDVPPDLEDQQQQQHQLQLQQPQVQQHPVQEDDLRRSSRIKRSVKPKRYLEFETTPITTNHRTQTSKNVSSSSSSSRIKYEKQPTEKMIQVKIEKEEIIIDDPHNTSPNRMPVLPVKKKEYFECEMCCAVFSDRAQLLVHVPIHI